MERNSDDLNPAQVENPPAIPTNVEENPPVPAWHGALFESRQDTLRAQERARLAEEELQRFRSQTPAPEPMAPGEPFQEPERFLKRITDHLDKQVAPLNAFIQEANRKDEYIKLKARIRSQNPGAAQALQQIEGHIDTAFFSNPSLLPNEQTFMMVLQNIVGGLMLSGTFPNNNNPNPASSNRPVNTTVNPPNIRPSAPPAPNNTSTQVDPNTFTEYERRMARENKMTLEEFAIMRDTPEDKVQDAWVKILADRKAKKVGGK